MLTFQLCLSEMSVENGLVMSYTSNKPLKDGIDFLCLFEPKHFT